MSTSSPRLGVRALGLDLDVRCSGPRAEEAHAALAGRWTLCATDPEGGLPFEAWLGADAPAHDPSASSAHVAGDDLAAFLVDVTHEVTYRAISANIGRLLMFHAAGICNPETGATVVFVAPGGTGKTTICRELAPDRGYVSDETIAIADDGTIVPYPKPLSVRRNGTETKDEVPPEALGLGALTVTPYVEAVLLLDRDDSGPQIPVVERLDPFHAITYLAPETSSLDQLPRPLHRLHDLLEGLALLARVRYREALTLEPMVTRLIGPPVESAGS